MTMTPDDAKTRWCPFARVLAPRHGATASTAFNRLSASRAHIDLPAGTHCIADACMAWRWHMSPLGVERAKAKVADPAYTQTEQDEHFAAATPYGYCGLAGAHGLD